MNETEEFFKYEIKKIQKDGDFKFIVDADVDLFTTLDNDFHVSFILPFWFFGFLFDV